MATFSFLTAVFPLVDGKLLQVGDLVKDFDFSKVNVKQERSRDNYLQCDLAPSFGELSLETIQKLDDELKIMIAGTTKQLVQLTPERRTWGDIAALCSQSPLLEPVDNGVEKSDSFVQNAPSDFKTNGSPDDNIVKEVNKWFKQLVSDEDVLNSTGMDAHVLGRIVAQSGAIIEDFSSFFVKGERHEQTVVDIQVIQYPDMVNPYFQIYRIRLTAWVDFTRTLFHQIAQNGIRGEFKARRYKPRSEIISRLSEKVKQQAMSVAESLFDF